MDEEIQKLIDALKVIRNHCVKISDCGDCELSDKHSECMMMINTPSEWDIREKSIKKVLL